MCEMEKIFRDSFQELIKISRENKNENEINTQESKLIFPKRRNVEESRISEQEPRVLFLRELEKQNAFYYSIETPSRSMYGDFSTEEPKIKTGQSARIDVTLYKKEDEKFRRKHLIEFKFGNVKTCTKDFLKLLCDDPKCKRNYYINLLDNENSGTIQSLIEKYEKSINYIYKTFPNEMVSDLLIMVGVLKTQKIYIFERINKKEREVKKPREVQIN